MNEPSFAGLCGLTTDDISQLCGAAERLAERGQLAQAARVYAGLEALEPSRFDFTLRRAELEAAQGELTAAEKTVGGFLNVDAYLPTPLLLRGLKLRSALTLASDPRISLDDERVAARLEQSTAVTWDAP